VASIPTETSREDPHAEGTSRPRRDVRLAGLMARGVAPATRPEPWPEAPLPPLAMAAPLTDDSLVWIHVVKQPREACLRIPAARMRPSLANALEMRAQGMPGASCTRSLVRDDQVKRTSSVTTGSAQSLRHSLHDGVRLAPCSPRSVYQSDRDYGFAGTARLG